MTFTMTSDKKTAILPFKKTLFWHIFFIQQKFIIHPEKTYITFRNKTQVPNPRIRRKTGPMKTEQVWSSLRETKHHSGHVLHHSFHFYNILSCSGCVYRLFFETLMSNDPCEESVTPANLENVEEFTLDPGEKWPLVSVFAYFGKIICV